MISALAITNWSDDQIEIMIPEVNIFFLWEPKSTQMKIILKNLLVDSEVTPMHLPTNPLLDIT